MGKKTTTKLTPEQHERQRQNQVRLEKIIERRLAEEEKLRAERGVDRV